VATVSRHPGWRLRDLLLGVPVIVKVMGIVLGMTILLSAGMLWQIHQTWHAHLVDDLEAREQRLVDRVAGRCAELIQAGRTAEVARELQNALSESPDTVLLVLEREDGTEVARAEAPAELSGASSLRELVAQPGAAPYRLRAGVSTAAVDQEVNWLTWRLARVTAVIAALGMLAAWWLTRLVAHPIQELVALTRGVMAGDYGNRAPVRARDEVGALAAVFNEMTVTLGQKEAGRQQLLRQVIHAAEEERQRIARELHDHTGQALTSQIAALGALENRSGDETLRQRLGELRRQTEQALAEVHDLTVALRPSVLDDVGLMAALQRHCRIFAERSAMQVACKNVGLDNQRLPAEVELTIYRLVQEALTNAVRHGQANRAQVLVQRTGRGVLASVLDNGRGFDVRDWQQRCVEDNRLGLLGIEERVALLGGSFCVESAPGQGAAVYADIPLQEPT
jgi:signal transduction histidine kinase